MKVRPLYLITLAALLLSGCVDKNADLSEVIERIERVGVSGILNTSMYVRERGVGTGSGVLYLNSADGPCGPYLVDFTYGSGNVNSIDDRLVRNTCPAGLYDSTTIAAFTHVFAKMDVVGIKVDADTNLFVRSSNVEVENLIRSKNGRVAAGMVPVPNHPKWYMMK